MTTDKMKLMLRLALVSIAFSAAALAQSEAVKAPAATDEALRARVQQFYQAHVDKKFRKADEVVAEESKDAFYEAAKPTIRGFEIKNIAYSDDFKKAAVTVSADSDFVFPGRGVVPWKRSMTSTWKLVDGQWFLFLDTGVVSTPFGKVPAGSGGGQAKPTALPMAGAAGNMDFSSVLKADKREVNLASAPSQDVTITNGMGGPVSLILSTPSVAGLSATLDRQTLKPKESARLTVRWQGDAKKKPAAPVTVTVGLKELPFSVPIKVVFSDAK